MNCQRKKTEIPKTFHFSIRVTMRRILGVFAIVAASAAGSMTTLPAQAQIPTGLTWPTDHRGITIVTHHGDNWPFANGCDGKAKRHVGIDISNPTGRPVYAAYPGTVVIVGYDSTWGYWITIQHAGSLPPGYYGPPSPWTSQYWHVNPSVKAGQVVTRGQQIGTIYNLGSNSHLHFGVRSDSYSNVSNRGALPATRSCGADDPQWPERTLDPLRFTAP